MFNKKYLWLSFSKERIKCLPSARMYEKEVDLYCDVIAHVIPSPHPGTARGEGKR